MLLILCQGYSGPSAFTSNQSPRSGVFLPPLTKSQSKNRYNHRDAEVSLFYTVPLQFIKESSPIITELAWSSPHIFH